MAVVQELYNVDLRLPNTALHTAFCLYPEKEAHGANIRQKTVCQAKELETIYTTAPGKW